MPLALWGFDVFALLWALWFLTPWVYVSLQHAPSEHFDEHIQAFELLKTSTSLSWYLVINFHFHLCFLFFKTFTFSFNLFLTFPFLSLCSPLSCLRQATTHLTIARKDWSSLYWNWLTFIFGVKQLCQQQNSNFSGKNQLRIKGSFLNTIWLKGIKM